MVAVIEDLSPDPEVEDTVVNSTEGAESGVEPVLATGGRSPVSEADV